MSRLTQVGLFAAVLFAPAWAAASPFDVREEIQQQRASGGGGPKAAQCGLFSKANKCQARYDIRMRTCVCM